jgi:lysophospholipase L1-like esterase
MAVDALARALAAGKVPVSAYEMAVKAGYTGTEEQFAEDMGNSGTNAANAAASASAAAASAESVEASAAQIATNTNDISDLKTQLGITTEASDSPESDWEQGIFQVSNGKKTASTTRLRTASDAGIDSAVQTATCKTGYQLMLFAWDANGYLGIYEGGVFIKADANWQTTADLADARNAGATILKIQMRKTDNATIDASAGTNVIYLIVNNETDNRITVLETETDGLTSRMSDAEANITELSADVTTMETSVDGIETILAYNRTEGGAPVSDWEQGALQVSNGTDVSNANRIRTVVTGISDNVTSVICTSGFSGFLCCWGSGTYLGIYEGGSFIKQNVSWLTAWDLKAVRNAGADLVRLIIRKDTNQAILPSEGTNVTYITETSSIDSLSDRLNVFENYMTEPYKGKKISILGDSISTFGGSVSDPSDERFSPEGNPYTYPGNRCRYPQTSLGVTQVTQTYWMQLIMALGMELGINDSWASSRTSWDGTTESTDIGANKYIASTTRIGHLDDNGTPDYILVNAGTNDIINNVTIGTIDDTDPSTIADFDNLPVSTFADAYRTLLCRLMHSYPNARIVCLLPNFATGYGSKKQDNYCEVIKELCDMYGIPYLDMRVNGVTPFNRSTYLGDGVHYNASGMTLVANELIRQFMALI